MVGAFQQSLEKYPPRSKENSSAILGIMKDLTPEVRSAVAGARPILPGAGIGPIEGDKISMIIAAAFQLLDNNGCAHNVDPDDFRWEGQEARRRLSQRSQSESSMDAMRLSFPLSLSISRRYECEASASLQSAINSTPGPTSRRRSASQAPGEASRPRRSPTIEALPREVEPGTVNAETSLRKSVRVKDLRDEVKESTRRMKYIASLIENDSDSGLLVKKGSRPE